MGIKQMPKCKNKECMFNRSGKYCKILRSKPTMPCSFYKPKGAVKNENNC